MTDLAAVVGPRLKGERERQALSQQSAGDALHLDSWVVEALEADDYLRVGPPVYVKGYLKRYAELLGLPSAEIVFGYESRMRASSVNDLRSSDEPTYVGAWTFSNLPWPRISSAIAVVLLIASLLWWKPWHHNVAPSPAPQVASLREAPTSRLALPSASAVAMPAPRISTAAIASPAREIPSLAKPPVRVASPAAAAGSALSQPDLVAGTVPARLRLSFSADSWVDVHDATGKRAFAGNGRANSVKTIVGVAPMHVYLGFASGVQLEINNRAVAIGRQFVAGDVARFELGADGALRRDPRSAPIPGTQASNTQPSG